MKSCIVIAGKYRTSFEVILLQSRKEESGGYSKIVCSFHINKAVEILQVEICNFLCILVLKIPTNEVMSGKFKTDTINADR